MIDVTLRKILNCLAEDVGFTTHLVVKKIGKIPSRRQSAAVRSRLNELYRDGYIAHLDDQKPVAWKRTAKGTALLAEMGDAGNEHI